MTESPQGGQPNGSGQPPWQGPSGDGTPGYPQPGAAAQPPGGYQSAGAGPAYGAPSSDISMSDTFNYAWEKFKANAGVLIGGVVAWSAAVGILFVILYAVMIGSMFASSSSSGAVSGVGMAGFGASWFLMLPLVFVGVALAQAALVNVTCLASAGRKIEFKDFFSIPNLKTVLLLSLVIGGATGLLGLTGIGALAVMLFSQFVMYFAIDQRQGVSDALRNGINLVTKNFGPSILVALVAYACAAIGSVGCGVGAIVGVPIGQLAIAYVYRRLIGQQPV